MFGNCNLFNIEIKLLKNFALILVLEEQGVAQYK